eukprot:3196788-Pyramimonas_sp.AAC.1
MGVWEAFRAGLARAGLSPGSLARGPMGRGVQEVEEAEECRLGALSTLGRRSTSLGGPPPRPVLRGFRSGPSRGDEDATRCRKYRPSNLDSRPSRRFFKSPMGAH